MLKDMRLGRLTAELAQRGDGVVVEPPNLESDTFRISGDATLVVEDNGVGRQRSELRLQLVSTDIAPTLEALGSLVGFIPAADEDFRPLLEVIEQAFADDPEGRADFMAGSK